MFRSFSWQRPSFLFQARIVAARPRQDDRVRRMVKTNVHSPDNVQGRLTAPQAPNDIVVNVFVTYQAKHLLVPSVPFGPAIWRAIPPGWAASPQSPAATFRPPAGGRGCNRQYL